MRNVDLYSNATWIINAGIKIQEHAELSRVICPPNKDKRGDLIITTSVKYRLIYLHVHIGKGW